jgi:hypothetical protein
MINRDNKFDILKALISLLIVALMVLALLSCAASKKKRPADILVDTTKTNFISELHSKDIQRDGENIVVHTPDLYFKLVKAANGTYYATTTKETITKTVTEQKMVPAIQINKTKDQRHINSGNKIKDQSKKDVGNKTNVGNKDKSMVDSGNKTKTKGISLWWLLLIIPVLFLYSQRKKILPFVRKTLVGI